MSQNVSNGSFLPSSHDCRPSDEGEPLSHTCQSTAPCPSSTPNTFLSTAPAASVHPAANTVWNLTGHSHVPPVLPLPHPWRTDSECQHARSGLLHSLHALRSGPQKSQKSARLPHVDAAALHLVSPSFTSEAALPCAVHSGPKETCYKMRTAAAEHTLQRLQRENDALKRQHIEWVGHREQLENTIGCLKEELTLMGRTVLKQSATLRKLPPSLVRCSPRQMLRQRRDGGEGAVLPTATGGPGHPSKGLAEGHSGSSGHLAAPSVDTRRGVGRGEAPAGCHVALPAERSAMATRASRWTTEEEAAEDGEVDKVGMRHRTRPISPSSRITQGIEHKRHEKEEEEEEWKHFALALDALLQSTSPHHIPHTTKPPHRKGNRHGPTRMTKDDGHDRVRTLVPSAAFPQHCREPVVFQICIRVLYAEVYRHFLAVWQHQRQCPPPIALLPATTTPSSSAMEDDPICLGEWDGFFIRLIGPSGETLLETVPEPLEREGVGRHHAALPWRRRRRTTREEERGTHTTGGDAAAKNQKKKKRRRRV